MALHDRSVATAARPVHEDANRWLDETGTVADGLAVGSLPDEEVVRIRLGHVEHLLPDVDGAENETANEHFASARTALADILTMLGNDDEGDE